MYFDVAFRPLVERIPQKPPAFHPIHRTTREHLMNSWIQDLRYSARRLVNACGFSLTVTLMLALGIGSMTAIFSLIDGILLRPLPFHASKCRSPSPQFSHHPIPSPKATSPYQTGTPGIPFRQRVHASSGKRSLPIRESSPSHTASASC